MIKASEKINNHLKQMSEQTNIFTLNNKIIFRDDESDESISSVEEKKHDVEDNVSKNSNKNNSVSDKFDKSSEYDESEETISMNYESENIKLYQLIKREYNNFQKQFRKNQIYYFFQILNVKKNEILNFCKELICKDYYNIIFAKTYYSYSALSINFLFYFLDLTFLLSDLLIKDNKIISSEKFYVDDMFSFILGNMFILREDPLDDEMKELFEHNICFWLSINILYFIYNNNAFEINSKTSKVKENNSNNNNKKRKRNDGNKDDFLEPIKQSTKSPNKPKTKKETIEKAIFRDFVRFITINENKEEIKQIIAQDKDFWKKLKNKEEYNGYNLGDYSQKLMKFLFEKDVIRELYKIY